MKRLIQGGVDLFLDKVVPNLTVQCVRTSQGFLRRSILHAVRSDNCELVSKNCACDRTFLSGESNFYFR
jgi:hypothetical protein